MKTLALLLSLVINSNHSDTEKWMAALENAMEQKNRGEEPRVCVGEICATCKATSHIIYCKLTTWTGGCYGECSFDGGCKGSCYGKL